MGRRRDSAMLARTRSSQRLISGDQPRQLLGRALNMGIRDRRCGCGHAGRQPCPAPAGRSPAAAGDGRWRRCAPLGEPGQGDQHLVDLFLADQLLQVLGVAQQRQRVVVLRGPARAVVDEPMMPERMSWLRTRYSARCMPLSVKPRITVRCRYMPRFLQAGQAQHQQAPHADTAGR